MNEKGKGARMDKQHHVTRKQSMVEFARLSPAEDMAELFARADVKKRGRITKPELGKLLVALNVDASETGLNVLFQALDTNRDGVITLDEFSAGFRLLREGRQSTSSSSSGLRSLAAAYDRVTFSELFAALDAHGDGKVSRAELRQLLESGGHAVSDQDFEMLWHAFDTNGDNVITEAEFHHGMTWLGVHMACAPNGDPTKLLAEICKTLIVTTGETAQRAFAKGQIKTAKAIAAIVDLPALGHAEARLGHALIDAETKKLIENIMSTAHS